MDETKVLIERHLSIIQTEESILSSFRIIKKRSEKTIAESREDIMSTIRRVLIKNVPTESPLAEFLMKKPEMPHEAHENYYVALSHVVTDVLLSDFGKSIPGSTDDFCFDWVIGRELWNVIREDLIKVLKEVGVTPFLDDAQSPSWVVIGFSVDAKWPPEIS